MEGGGGKGVSAKCMFQEGKRGTTGRTYRDLEIVTEFHVLEEIERLSHGDVSVGLEEHHGNGSSGQHVSHNELGQHIKTKLGVGNALYHANGDEEDNRDEHGDDECPPGQVGVPDEDGDQRHGEQDDEESIVPPVGSVDVLLHHLEMDIGILVASQLATLPDLGAVEDGGVHNDRGQGAEGDAVGEREECAEEEGRVGLVRRDIEGLFWRQDLRNVVCGSGVVEGVCLEPEVSR